LQYVVCTDGVSQLAECPDEQVFSQGKCTPIEQVAECRSSEPASPIDCSIRDDGNYGLGCTSNFIFCSGGIAMPMECPSSLVFNEAKGYCDYPEACESKGSASAAAASAPAADSSKSVSSNYCALRKDGFYSDGCTVDFISCEQGVATPMKCPPNLVFNGKKGYCDYPESCSGESSQDQPSRPSQPAPQEPALSCVGRPNGYHAEGCSPDFVLCRDGVATAMKCPSGLLFNKDKGYCDYPEDCQAGGSGKPAAPPPPQFESTYASDNSAAASPALDCTGRRDGYHSNGCSSDFVFCNDGTTTAMKCPGSLVFNMQKQQCDYVDNCLSENQDITTRAPVRVPPATSVVDCAGKADGFYSNGCNPSYVFCNGGVATAMKCPSSLVFNQDKGQCDYPENCSAGAPVVLPPVTVTQPPPLAATQPPAPVVNTVYNFSVVDCKGKKDGYYSNGCSSDFVFCNEGVATAMKCPSSLVFNEKKGHCDYPEACSSAPAAPTQPVPSPPPVYSPPTSSVVNCAGKQNGYYSNGCTPNFVFCNEGVATAMQCPPTLVFNEKKGHCDYAENCSTVPPVAAPMPAPSVAPAPAPAMQPSAPVAAAPVMSVDCKTKPDGYYSLGCTSDFVHCNEGMSTPMKCPSSLVFNEKKGYCDYPENCTPAPVAAPPAPVAPAPAPSVVAPPPPPAPAMQPPAPATVPQTVKSIDCKTKQDGYYSMGCTSDYVFCNEGVATTMKCPSSLVYNEKKGYCDYPENCTPEAVAPPPAPVVPAPAPSVVPPPAPAPAMQPPAPAAVPQIAKTVDCKTKQDGYYSLGCTSDYVYCNEGVATTMKCPSSLVYNEKKGYCDYPENCTPEPVAPPPAPVVPAPAPSVVPPPAPAPAMQPPAPAAVPQIAKTVDCKTKQDGYYSLGCTSDFIFCNEGVAITMKCPSSLVFNEEKGYCDYPENCSSAPVPPSQAAPPQPAPTVYAPPASSVVDCKGKKDGYYSNGCSPTFVFCNEGVATSMTCPPTLVFNEKKGHCDYAENCAAETSMAPSAPAPSVVPAPMPAMQPPAPVVITIDCKAKPDGYYSLGCSSDFVFCNEGVAITMKCPSSLVFNEKKGYCDYPENCTPEPIAPPPAPSVVPPPAPTVVPPPPAPAMQPPAPVPAPKTVTAVDCKTKPDGYYSMGCTSEFVFCNEGMAITMKCPSSLVFNEKKGYCDYPENCTPEPAAPLPAPSVVPAPAPTVVPPPPPAPAMQPPAPVPAPQTVVVVDCKTKPDGYYSMGCTSEFVFCNEGTATTMKCPSSLVFNEKKGYCDYPENCSSAASPPAAPPKPTPTVYAPPTPLVVDCAGKKDGYYSNGCSPTFVFCNEGVATSMKCPPTLVFNEKKGHCDYAENCAEDAQRAPPILAPTVVAPPPPVAAQIVNTIDCKTKKDGYYSMGCTSEFVFCNEGIATTMKCPSSLVFNEKKGYCDYPENCTPEPVAPPPAPSVVPPPAPTVVPPPPAPAMQPPAPVPAPQLVTTVDCKTKPDGYYSMGCTSEFVFCNEGMATTMKCPSLLVFNEKKGYCDYPENCTPGPVASPPAASAPNVVPAPVPPMSSPVDCAWKKDGYYSNGCSPTFVFCSEGVATSMVSRNALLHWFSTKKKGHCDYVENCSAESPLVPHPEPAMKPPAPVRVPTPTTSKVDCAGKKDGYYSNGCTPEFVYCSEGVATTMVVLTFICEHIFDRNRRGRVFFQKCPPTLVFNEKKGHCDYVENCSETRPTPPVLAPTVLSLSPAPSMAPPVPPPAPVISSGRVDCTGKKDGYYSNGCSSEFVFCNEGIATTMKCPASLVFNEKKGHCDYPENCSSGAAPMPPPLPAPSVVPPPPAPAMRPPASTRVDCTGKKDGYYSNGCVPEFVFCNEGVPTTMKCPPTLVFNEKKGHCDYVENCSAETKPLAASPMPKPHPPALSPPSPSIVECTGKKDGYYSNGCSPVFVYCSEGVATSMKCPPTLVFNEKKGHCDYAENCSAETLVLPPPPPPAPSMQPPAPVYAPPAEKFVDCVGKKDGYYSTGCIPEFVLCTDGVATTMKCPPTLVFNGKKGQCDYAENCEGEAPAPPAVIKPMAPGLAPSYATQNLTGGVDCAGKKDGYYSNGCFSDFVYCSEGVATKMTCPSLLVFNEKKGYCDYPESCISETPSPVPPPVNAMPVPSPPSAYAPPPSSTPGVVDCAGKSDGYYSNGCSPVFVFCSEGVATSMKCPPSLVFNEKKGHCDYVENCSSDVPPVMPIPPLPKPAVPPLALAQPAPKGPVTCLGKADGYYSNGCSPDFVYCSEGTSTPMKCPSTLVFNEKKGHCDYVENCSSDEPAAVPPMMDNHAPAYFEPESSHVDCAGKPDGYYANGCSSEFVYCSEGFPTVMMCPSSLVFNEKSGHCDYPENCIVKVAPTPVMPSPPTVAPGPPIPLPVHTPPSSSSVNCVGKPDGYYSNGCSATFVHCSEGVATPMECPPTLVFNEKEGYCDYVENCSSDVPQVIPNLPVVPSAQTAPPPAPGYAPPTQGFVDCSGKPDGYYSKGCSHEFVFCTDGIATPMKCPSSLVFNAEKGHCDYVENCSSDVPPAPLPSVPQVQPPRPQAPPMPLGQVDCRGKKEGFYSSGCSPEFVYCSEGVATIMKCPVSLVFNEKNGHCDYPENCSDKVVAPVAPVPLPQQARPPTPSLAPSGIVDCKGRPNGYHSNGCSPDFVFCNEGVATVMKCPQSLVFNEKKGYCDYVENCSGAVPPVVAPIPAPKPPPVQPPAFSPPSALTSADCTGRPNGYHSLGCTSEFVFCNEGVTTLMKCPASLVFNEKKGYCDYPENCSSELPPVAPAPSPLPAKPVPPPALAPPAATLDCTGRPNGYHSNGCTAEFVFCSEGMATIMKCPASLVFNEKKGYCDYPENCSSSVAPPAPVPSPVPKPPQMGQPPALSPPAGASPMDCTGRPNGYHSNGCTPEFMFCSEGVATIMKCPESLVFNEKKGYCDYVENCSSGAPVPRPMPQPVQPPALSPPAATGPLDCTGRPNGYHSIGCTPDFVFCVEGVATVMKCPASLVFNEKKGYCDYPENCSSPVVAPAPIPSPVPKPPQMGQPPALSPPAGASPMDCTGRPNGYHSNGCTTEFVFCSEGVATIMKCPASLVFNEKKGYCDYVENCSSTGPAPVPAPQPAQPPALSPPAAAGPMDCTGRPNGYHSIGCTPDFVFCVEGVATMMKCPASLVFNEKKGYCDYPENCSSPVASPAPVPSPVPQQPAQPPALSQPTSSKPLDCTGRSNGYHSNGCSADFVFCSEGVATIMKCPASLVFNEKKGYCDYVENCSSTGPAPVPAPQPAQPPALSPPAAVGPMDCTGRPNGYHSIGCTPDFVFCVEGVATMMLLFQKCPASLVFNEKKGYCDYPENCSSPVAPPAPVPSPLPQQPAQPPALSQPTSKPLDCTGRSNGYHSNGCSADFVFCSEGVATIMKCPASLVFDEKKGYCDYPENCSSGVVPVAPQPAPSPPQTAPPPAQSQAALDCTGRPNGYHSNGCTPEFVFCVDGVATVMKCPASLVFNKKKGYCDYPENCSAGAPPVAPAPVPSQPSQPPALSPPAASGPLDCTGRPNGYHSNGCTPEFVFCVDGVATVMKCPASLVFNEKKGYCDYPENCSGGAPMVPAPTPSQPSQPPALSPPAASGPLDCTGRPNGYHSNGCTPEFVFCVDGVATVMKCPASLVFNEKKGYCDYPENCSPGMAPVPPQPTPVAPQPAQPPAHSQSALDCTGRTNGYHSNGCTPEFVYCVDGVATVMKCPASLVFNEKKGYCDYPENCSAGAPPAAPAPIPSKPSQPPSLSPPPSTLVLPLDCTGRPNGYHSNGCTAEFVFCSEGMATIMKCPASLVFNEKKGYCDYPENCSAGAPPVAPAPVPSQPSQPPALSPPAASGPLDCTGRPNGYHSNGCTPEFVFCVDGVATVMKCPASLVFNEKKGYCDYPENCSAGAPPVAPAPVPSQPSQPPAMSPPASTNVDCAGRPTGYYSKGCSGDFVFCNEGTATLMKCPSSLVFNEKKGYCDYPENCSSEVPPAAPLPSQPSQPQPSQPPQMSPPSSTINCAGRENGYFSNGCSAEFVFCNEGVATQMKCPASLVYNERKGYCDYPENCSGGVPQPGPASPQPAQPVQPVPPPAHSQPLDCTGRSDGHYSNGCSPDFVFCSDGVATMMKCPSSLVFNEKKGYCDYPENCTGGVPSVAPQPGPVPPQPAQPPAHSQPLDCTGRPNGHYSNGCSQDFVFCNDGVATMMKCPASLVFNEQKGYCDYPENCSSGVPPVAPQPGPVPPSSGRLPKPSKPVYSPPSGSSPIDCTGRPDGHYSNGCSPEFVLCSDGVATMMVRMKCPSSLVFNEKEGYCDYPESCSSGVAAPVPLPPVAQSQQAAPPVTSSGLNCAGRKNGYYSDGCSSEFVYCSEGIATMMKCPAGLAYNEKKGFCDYPESCSGGASPEVAIPGPAPSKPATVPTPAPPKPAQPPAFSPPT
ncbi:chitin binding Peritrophin-A domain protein, partial [Ancylostoma caninum]